MSLHNLRSFKISSVHVCVASILPLSIFYLKMIRVPALNVFMAELLQDQRVLRGDHSDDEDVILLSDNSKLPSNASQRSRDGTKRTRPALFTEGMGGFAPPEMTQCRWSDSSSTSIHKHKEDTSFATPNSTRSSSCDSPPMVPKKPSNASPFSRDSTMLQKRPTSFTGGMGSSGFASPKKTQFPRSSSDSSIHNWDAACPSTPASRWDSSPKVPKKGWSYPSTKTSRG